MEVTRVNLGLAPCVEHPVVYVLSACAWGRPGKNQIHEATFRSGSEVHGEPKKQRVRSHARDIYNNKKTTTHNANVRLLEHLYGRSNTLLADTSELGTLNCPRRPAR